MAILERVRLLARVSRPIGCLLVSSTYFLGIIHSGSYPELLPGILLALAFSFPLCLGIHHMRWFNDTLFR